jgi:hypothetical protein
MSLALRARSFVFMDDSKGVEGTRSDSSSLEKHYVCCIIMDRNIHGVSEHPITLYAFLQMTISDLDSSITNVSSMPSLFIVPQRS